MTQVMPALGVNTIPVFRLGLTSGRAFEFERSRIHAIALSAWGGPITENMTQVTSASGANDFRTFLAIAVVGDPLDTIGQGVREARPTCAGTKLILRGK